MLQHESRTYWPRDLPRSIRVPDTSIWANLDIAARRHPAAPAIHFLGRDISYRELHADVERLAGWLVHAGVRGGDRVLLYLQNSPQWLIAYYAILRADAVVVPVNPMNRTPEVRHYLQDSGAVAAISATDLLEQLQDAAAGTAQLQCIVAVDYADYLPEASPYEVPQWLQSRGGSATGSVAWTEALDACHMAGPAKARAHDLCGFFYTSGSTGKPKACMLTHGAFLHNILGQALWHWASPGMAVLASAPMFHVSGLNHGVHLPIYVGGTAVILPRWDRRLALQLMSDQRIAHASIPPTALADLLCNPELAEYDLGNLRRLTSGGAPMPESLFRELQERLHVSFIEAYGLTETAATTHLNPIHKPKVGSLGLPFFGTTSIVVDPQTLVELPQGETGEILVAGPQLFGGYWSRPEETQQAFVDVRGQRFLRTGDIGYVDDEGYFFMTDRAKRMINAAGYKVWPAEVERVLYGHPGVKEVCVIGTVDSYRGETVKALVVKKGGADLDAQGLIAWARERMATYKSPRIIKFIDDLPKSASGKILWRELQDAEDAKSRSPNTTS